jgi:hypothetical protein
MTDSWGNLKVPGDFHPKRRQVCSLRQKEAEIKLISAKYSDTSAKLQDLSPVLEDGTLLADLDCATTTTDLNVSLVKSKIRSKGGVDAAALAKNWGIGIEAAKRTRLVITQRGIRWMTQPSLTKRYITNNRQLRYRRLPVAIFTDTMYSTILFRQQNNHKFCTDFGFVRAFPMKLEIEAHEALSLLFHRDGVPNVMFMDGSKANTEGKFRRKLHDTGFHINQTEPHTQSSNMGEGGVRELKRGVGWQMMRSGCPNRLWDDCIIWEAYAR